jgi:hypothetical protein
MATLFARLYCWARAIASSDSPIPIAQLAVNHPRIRKILKRRGVEREESVRNSKLLRLSLISDVLIDLRMDVKWPFEHYP